MTVTQSKEILLIESQYFPSVDFYKSLIKADILQVEKYEHYQKVSFRNRCYIAGPNGVILLSVPLSKGKNQRTIMKDVRISYEENWQALHLKTLTSAYRRSPYFEFYETEIEDLFSRKFDFLLDWNMACLEWVNSVMGIKKEITFTAEFQKTYDPATGIIDKRDHMVPGQNTENAPVYTQVFGERTGFFPNLSILDLLFCEGKRGVGLLQ